MQSTRLCFDLEEMQVVEAELRGRRCLAGAWQREHGKDTKRAVASDL